MKTAQEILDSHYSYMDYRGRGLDKEDILLAMEEYAGQFKPELISIKDKQPETGQRIVAYIQRHQEESIDYWGIRYITNLADLANFTHWMPLPEPPAILRNDKWNEFKRDLDAAKVGDTLVININESLPEYRIMVAINEKAVELNCTVSRNQTRKPLLSFTFE